MVSIEQAQRGIMRYIDSDILPHLDTARRFAVALYVNLAAEQVKAKADVLLQNPAIKMLGVYDGGMIDIDRIKNAAINQLAHDDRIDITLPVIGQMVFHRSDIEALYRSILDA